MSVTGYTKAGADALLAVKANTADLATVATSGSYTDLINKPTLFSGAYGDLTGKPTLGTAAAQNVTAFATAAQGTKADTAVQPADLATVATTGSYNDLTNKPSGGLPGIAPRTGEYIWTAGASDGSTYPLAASRAELAAIFLTAGTYQSAGFLIRTAGATGSLIRVVLYKDDTLIKDFGTVSGETAGNVTATATVTIAATGWYLIGLISQGVTTTVPAVNRVMPSNTAGILPNTKNDPQYSPGGSFGYAGISGAAPSDLSSTARATDNYAPAVNMRLA